MGGTQKVLLIGIASHADRYGDNAWPSIETLAKYAHVDARSVQRAITDLVKAGLLFRGVNEGGSRQTASHMRPNLYRLNMVFQAESGAKSVAKTTEKHPPAPASPPDASVTPPPDASVTTPLTPVSPLPLTPASPEQSIEPSLNHPGNKYNAPVVRPGDVTEQVWLDFLALRKERRSNLTSTALAGIRNAAAKAGFTLQAALELCCERGWQSFRAEWVLPPSSGSGTKPGLSKTEALRERNRQNARQWLNETGGENHASA